MSIKTAATITLPSLSIVGALAEQGMRIARGRARTEAR